MITPEQRHAIFDSIRSEIKTMSDLYTKKKTGDISAGEQDRLDKEIYEATTTIGLLLEKLDELYRQTDEDVQ